MQPFEYVVVLISLILGLGIAQLLNGLADMLAHYKKTKFSVAHTLYVIVVFLVFCQDWFYTYQYSKQIEHWTLSIILSLLIFPIALFLLARFLFPTGSRSRETDMVAYFEENWRWFYALFSLTIVISIIQNILISGYTLVEQTLLFCYLTAYLIFLIGDIKRKIYHNIFMILQLLLWIVFVFFDTTSLS